MKSTYAVKGMHCPSCNIIVKQALEKEPGIVATADYRRGDVVITANRQIELSLINKRLKKYGYELLPSGSSVGFSAKPSALLIGIVLVAVLFLVPVFKYFNLLGGQWLAVSSGVTFLTAFLIGLVASFSTCMATTGVFFLSLYEELASSQSRRQEGWRFTLLFATGRLVAYGFFGGLIGLIGKSLLVQPIISGLFTIMISFFMLLIGLSLISERFRIMAFPSVKLINGLVKRANQYPRLAPLLFGGMTFFMPCGFTQSLQLYALQSGGFYQGAGLLLLFALGTLPSIIGIGVMVRLGQKSFAGAFSLISGLLIFAFALYNLTNGLALTGVVLPFLIPSSESLAAASVKQDRQILEMTVDSLGYLPRVFTVKKGRPVLWKIQGVNVYGCQSLLVVPPLGLSQRILEGENIIEFTPEKSGRILFSCGMGMFRGVIKVI